MIWIAILIGHIGLWCFIFNRTHATAWPRTWRKLIEKAIILIVFIPIGLVSLWLWNADNWCLTAIAGTNYSLLCYAYLCGATAGLLTGAWLMRIATTRLLPQIKHRRRTIFNVESQLGRRLTEGLFANILRRVPGNRCCWLELLESEIQVGKRFAGLDGLKIAHLSDFHFTGGIRREYFEFVVSQVNASNCDLVFLTGDLIDRAECLAWIEPVFSRLNSRLGKYYVLGNHDLLIPDEVDYRKRLEAVGLVSLADGQWHRVQFNGSTILLAGNELPWYPGAKSLPAAPESHDTKILLSHSPDQVHWGVNHRFDFMFAGHTHGGQIRFPIIGPVISPSRYGVRFASGEFQIGEMLMLVSRGVSGDEPIRWNCLPQVTVWTLKLQK